MSSFGQTNPERGSGRSRYPGTFLLALREAMAKNDLTPVSWKGSSVECQTADGQSQEIGLENMYRRLRSEPRERWADLIAELIGSVPPEVANPPSDLIDVADRLLVRLGAPIRRENPQIDVWSLPLVEHHLSASLVIDYPSSMSYVTEKQIAQSGQDATYWYERALANLLKQSAEDCFEIVHEESGLLKPGVADAYDSSRGLLLDLLIPGNEENGFYVVVPSRDHLLVLPLNAETLTAAPWLRAIATKTYKEMPYPISPELFWVRGGIWHHFGIEPDGEDVVIHPPPDFLDVMKRLRPDQEVIDDTGESDDGNTETKPSGDES